MLRQALLLALPVGKQLLPSSELAIPFVESDPTVDCGEGAAASLALEASTTQDDSEYCAALRRGLRLFAVYGDAGGALCMRPTVWRKLMVVLHPDRGGDARVFQLISTFKRQLDAGETLQLPLVGPPLTGPSQADNETEALEEKLRKDLHTAANGATASGAPDKEPPLSLPAGYEDTDEGAVRATEATAAVTHVG